MRAEQRKQHSGPSTAPETARRLAHLENLRQLAYADKRREDGLARPIPTSGPGRRRAKARRNVRAVQRTELCRRVDRVIAASDTFAFPRSIHADLVNLCEIHVDEGLTPDLARLRIVEARWENRAYVCIDPNQRVMGNRGLASFEDCTRPVFDGEAVRVIEVEDGIEAEAVVYAVDRQRGLLYLDVAWNGFRDVDPELLPALRAQLDFLAKTARLAREQGVSHVEAAAIARTVAGMHGVGLAITELTEPLNTAADAVNALVAALIESEQQDE